MFQSVVGLPLRDRHVAIIGAGVGGLAAAMLLSARGMRVTVIERAGRAGGKMSGVTIAGQALDSGPTVFTLKPVFQELFAQCGVDFDRHVATRPLSILARHAWPDGGRLDLYADKGRSAAAIADFAGRADADGFRRFCRDAERIYRTLEKPFLRAPAPSLAGLIGSAGLSGLPRLAAIRPFTTLWKALDGYFRDPRLKQLFARYATYSGASPFAAPATLMLIAHVEQAGVWSIDGGMYRLAGAMQTVAESQGAEFRFGVEARDIETHHGRVSGVALADGSVIAADAVIANADAGALRSGLLGTAAAQALPDRPPPAPSLSAVTWAMTGRAEGFDLARHTVFFSDDYAGEFDDILKHGDLPRRPTVYICAQDRHDGPPPDAPGEERFLCLVNAPAHVGGRQYTRMEIEQCQTRMQCLLMNCGLRLQMTGGAPVMRAPADYAAMFPGSGGALYGPAMHGWKAAFRRPPVTTRLPGLYLAGGSVHPGPGVPMAALSGRMAALRLCADSGLTAPSRRADMAGGISMQSAMTGGTP